MSNQNRPRICYAYLIVPVVVFTLVALLYFYDYLKPLVIGTSGHADETRPPVQATLAPTPESQGEVDNPELYRITANETLSLREEPSIKAEVIEVLLAGDTVEVVERTGCFYKVVSKNEHTGYVLSGYLAPVELDSDLVNLKVVDTTKADYSYDEMMGDIKELSTQYTDFMTVDCIGTSYDGRDIPVIVVGNKEAEHQVLIHGGIHGREHMTVMVVMKQLEYYLSMKAKGEDGAWLRDVAFRIIPMLNPDGVMISQQGPQAIRDDELRAKLEAIHNNDKKKGNKMSDETYFTQWKSNARGVNINLNFDANWDGTSSSKYPSYVYYKGDAPESELETQSIIDYTKAQDLDATLSYHAYGSGYYWEFHQTGTLKEANESLGKSIEGVSGYKSLNHEDSATNGGGGYKDWAIETLQIPSLTIEIGSTACPLHIREFATIWERNKDVWKATAEWVLEQ